MNILSSSFVGSGGSGGVLGRWGSRVPVAHESPFRPGDVTGGRRWKGPGNKVRGEFEMEAGSARLDDGARGRCMLGQRDTLNVAAIGIARHKTDTLELADEVVHGDRLSAGADRASLEIVRSEGLDVLEKVARVHLLQRPPNIRRGAAHIGGRRAARATPAERCAHRGSLMAPLPVLVT